MKYFIQLVFILFSLAALCQTKAPPGIWYAASEEIPEFNWEAQWIWMHDSIAADALLARKSFVLTKKPVKAILRITATSQYQLYINGKYIRRGPARSAPHHQSFDILNVTSELKEGNNLIAVRVHRQHQKFSYQLPQRGGLLVQLDFKSEAGLNSIYTDHNWRVSPDLSLENNRVVISRFQQVVSDRVDMREHQNNWENEKFDDSEWAGAKVLSRNDGWPDVQENEKPNELTLPWTSLLPRDIPYLIEQKLSVSKLIHAAAIIKGEFTEPIPISHKIPKRFSEILKRYNSEKGPMVIPETEDGKGWLLVFDFGALINGVPYLEVKGSNSVVLEIVGAPYILDNSFSYKLVDSEFRDIMTLSGKRETWEATYFKPYRYMGIVLKNLKEPLEIYDFGVRSLNYPFEKKGEIVSEDAAWIGQYMNATSKTIRVCTTDAFTDNYRERRQYAQTGYYGALGNYYLFGDTALQRRYLLQTAQEQQSNGIMPAYAPAASDDFMVILDSNCLWIRSLYNYLLYTGDYETVKALLPSARKLMQLLHGFTNEHGMLDNPPYAYWLDHAYLDRRGANLTLNGHFLGALEDFSGLLAWLDDPASKIWQDRATELRTALRTKFWNQERRLFTDALIDGNQSYRFSEHSNATALALNIASPEQAEEISRQLLEKDEHDFIKRESGLIMVTPAMSYYLHKGLCAAGHVDASFELFRSRFDKMLSSELNGTLWEEWWLNGTGRSGVFDGRKTRSDAQTESAFAPALFAEYLLGVKPIKPGMELVEVMCAKSDIKQIHGIIPCPQGSLYIKWNVEKNGQRSLNLEIPKGMVIHLNLHSLRFDSDKEVLIDGKAISTESHEGPFASLTSGEHRILF
ncbi:MAG: alpha-L-rhamnosidase N-terminal domain-containing protein [Bacteroidota bacterium]